MMDSVTLEKGRITRLIDGDALIKEACAEGAYGYVDAKQIADASTLVCNFCMYMVKVST